MCVTAISVNQPTSEEVVKEVLLFNDGPKDPEDLPEALIIETKAGKVQRLTFHIPVVFVIDVRSYKISLTSDGESFTKQVLEFDDDIEMPEKDQAWLWIAVRTARMYATLLPKDLTKFGLPEDKQRAWIIKMLDEAPFDEANL